MLFNLRRAIPIALSLFASANSQGGPISSCISNQQGLVTCNLYETDDSEASTERPPKVAIGSPVNLGFVVFLEPGVDPSAPDNQVDVATWSDVLSFTSSEDQFFVQLISRPLPADLPQLVLEQNPTFQAESPIDPTVFIGGSGNTYNIFSEGAPPSEVPEPPTLLAFLLGVLATFIGGAFQHRAGRI